MSPSFNPVRLLLALTLACSTASMLAQRGGGGMGPSGGMRPGGDRGFGSIGRSREIGPVLSPNTSVHSSGKIGSTHAMVQVGPPGRWWDDKKFAKHIGIADDQRKRMDSIFNENKHSLSASYAALQQEESTLNKLVHAKQPDEQKIMAQIDQVAQARADLEKSATRMLLALRRELSDEQWSKLEEKTVETKPAAPDEP